MLHLLLAFEIVGWIPTWLTIVSEECDDEVVAPCEQVHGVAEEVGDPVIWSDEWQ